MDFRFLVFDHRCFSGLEGGKEVPEVLDFLWVMFCFGTAHNDSELLGIASGYMRFRFSSARSRDCSWWATKEEHSQGHATARRGG